MIFLFMLVSESTKWLTRQDKTNDLKCGATGRFPVVKSKQPTKLKDEAKMARILLIEWSGSSWSSMAYLPRLQT